jgi:ubiquinone/menaquinone biosynthesis C-methylase UbiE
MRASATKWLLERYGFGSTLEMREHLQAAETLLDLGSGSGYSTSLWFDGWSGARYIAVDISSAIDVAKERLGSVPDTWFVQADALHLPFRAGTFGAVIAEGVLHHTPSTKEALRAAAGVVRPGGELLFYVYRTKGPVREFTDDFVRERVSHLSDEAVWREMESLTRLAHALADLRAVVDVPEEVRTLGIPAGRIDVQRLFYWYFSKLFWNDDYAFDENVHVNFDWYRPAYAHRQTPDEVRAWCGDLGLDIERFHVDDAGITVRARRGEGTR